MLPFLLALIPSSITIPVAAQSFEVSIGGVKLEVNTPAVSVTVHKV